MKLKIEEICKRYSKLYSGLVYDVLEETGLPNQILHRDIKPIYYKMKLAAPAFIIIGEASKSRIQQDRIFRLGINKHMKFPCIEVRTSGGENTAGHYGELSANIARVAGSTGVLTDGGVRDSMTLIEMDYPTFCRYQLPVEAFGRWRAIDYQKKIYFKGDLQDKVEINPGDFIFGDIDGVLIIPKELTEEILLKCEEVYEAENVSRVDYKSGMDPIDVFKKYKRL